MKKKIALLLTLATAACLTLSACGAGGDYMSNGSEHWNGSGDHWSGGYIPIAPGDNAGGEAGGASSAEEGMPDSVTGDGETGDNESNSFHYNSVVEQPFISVTENTSSYFSLDRNTASYSQMRYNINRGYTVSADSVRIEEYINYFDYDLPAPTDEAVSVSTHLSDCPWNADNKLLMTGVRTADIDLSERNGNYVFLVDVSGSMSGDNRIGLAKKGFSKLVDNLGEGDIVSIVTYASGMEVKLDGAECSGDKAAIKQVFNGLRASGSTNGRGGLELAYRTAEKHFITGGNNRVIIISDGDFNVGNSTTTAMMEFIQDKAESGVYLSVFGVGMGNMRDDMLETLARNGNGNYAYLDSELEADKAFTHDLNGTLVTVAKDAKAGVTFTENVEKYRLIGYDTKYISQEEFDDEQTDTGEIGSGLCVVALYEITLKADADGEIATAEVRYKDVRDGGEQSKSVTATATTQTESSTDLEFVSCVAEFGLVLRKSQHKASASLAAVAERLQSLNSYIEGDSYKTEFVELVNKALRTERYN